MRFLQFSFLRCFSTLLLLSVCATASGQGYVLDQGKRPIPVIYREDAADAGKVIGRLEYKVTLENGNPVNSSIDSFSFAGQELARLILDVHVVMDRPNNRKTRDMRVIFSEEAFDMMRGKFWRVDQSRGRAYDVALGHDGRAQFHFTYPQNGTVNFNLPFVVAPASSRSDTWLLPDRYTTENHVLSRQIKVTGILTEEEKMWLASKGHFPGVANYLTAYPRGYHSQEAGRFFFNYANGQFDELVTSGRVSDGPEQFIEYFTPYKRFSLIANLLAQARGVIDARSKAVATKPRTRRTTTKRKKTRSVPAAASPAPEMPDPEPELTGDEPKFRITTGSNGEEIIKLYNFDNPAYYDIYGGLLEIDDSELLSDNILRIRQIKQGTVNFLVIERDQPRKYLSILLDNIMEVSVNEDVGYGKFDFSIDGGVAPYGIYLRPRDGQGTSWAMRDINEQEFPIRFDELQFAGLEGRYQVLVSSHGSPRELPLKEDIEIPSSGHLPWLKPLLIALGLGGFAILLLVILSRAGRRRPRQRVRV